MYNIIMTFRLDFLRDESFYSECIFKYLYFISYRERERPGMPKYTAP